MKKLNRFVAKCAMVLLLLTFLLPAINWGQFLSNLTPVAFAVPACADIPDQPTCDGYAPACYWDGSCQTNECGDGVEGGPGEECDDGNSDPDDGCSEYCLVEYCGDSIQQAGEECDDGNTNSDDGCSDSCIFEYCGDGALQAGEECDDGANDDGDGCDNTCMLEYCGDGVTNHDWITDTDEACDDGGESASCNADCTYNGCGDGTLNVTAGEECDDGNTDPGDGCDASCQLESGCGDGTLDEGEQCDDNNVNAGDGCSPECTWEAPPVPMFVTSTSSNGALGGAAGADAICQDRAEAASFGGTWQAVITDSTRPDLDTFLPEAPYVRAADGTVISYNKAMFLGYGSLTNAILKTELDDNSESNVWTGWDTFGSNVCSDWTNDTTSYSGAYGIADQSASGMWLYSTTTTCDALFALYCIQTDAPEIPVCDPACDEPEVCVLDQGQPICIMPNVCGNGFLEEENNEACDDGNVDPGDGCDENCQEEVCGDAIIQYGIGEQCDDGGTDPGDGCDENCMTEGNPLSITSTFPIQGGTMGVDLNIQLIADPSADRDIDLDIGTLTSGSTVFLCPGNVADLAACEAPLNVILENEVNPGDCSMDKYGLYDYNCDGTMNGIRIHPENPLTDGQAYTVFLQDVCWDNGIEGVSYVYVPDYCLVSTEFALHFTAAVDEGCSSFGDMETCHNDADEYACIWDNSACRNAENCIELTPSSQEACTSEIDPLDCEWRLFCGGAEGCDLITDETTCDNTPDCGWGMGAGCRDAWTPIMVDEAFCIITVGACGPTESCFEVEEGVYACQETGGGPVCDPPCSEGEICVEIEEGVYVCQETGGEVFCGNDVAEGTDPVTGGDGEPCDGTDLRGRMTCDEIEGAGFVGGSLSCTNECYFDTTQCIGGYGEVCSNGVDDDEDGDVDCDDEDCSEAPWCGGGGGEICDNELDDDFDDYIDCDDVDCSFFPACGGGGYPAFMFITSEQYSGNLGGVAGADAKCQARADDAGLDGTWHALISDATVDAADRLPDRQYMRVGDFKPIANGKQDLLDGNIINPITKDEFGASVTVYCPPGQPAPQCMAWTGSLYNGTYAVPTVAGYSDLACNNWSSNSASGRAVVGVARVTFSDWLDGIPEGDGALFCGDSYSLYCYSADSSGGEPPQEGFCGDGVINAPGEQCDVNDFGGVNCSAVGLDPGTSPGCTPTCLLDFLPCGGTYVCGNGGPTEPGEACDDGNTINGDGCNEFCQWEGDAGTNCGGYGEPLSCAADNMCVWDWEVQGGMCVPGMVSPCNSYFNQTTCENDPMCFWNLNFFNPETDAWGECQENFGWGYPDMTDDEIYTFPQPFNNSSSPLTDGDPYSLGNRPDMMMNGVPRMWDINMAPMIIGFNAPHGIPEGQEANYIKLYRYDSLTGQWTDRTGNLLFSPVAPIVSMNTEDQGWFHSLIAAIKEFFIPSSYAYVPPQYEIMALTINPLAENTIYRVTVSGVAGFGGQNRACPDGSGNLCHTSTFRTGDSMVPTGDYQGGGGDYEDNYGDFGCQEGDTIEALWPFEGATDVDPNTVVSLQVCDAGIDLSEVDAVFYELWGGCTPGDNCYSIPGTLFIQDSTVVVEHQIPLTPGMDWMLDIDDGNYQFNFTTGNFDNFEGGPLFGTGRLTVYIIEDDEVDDTIIGDPMEADENGVRIIVACGDLTMPEMDPQNPGPQQPTGNSFFTEGLIPSGESRVVITGIPTSSLGEDFSNPCVVFPAPETQGFALGDNYYYMGGTGTQQDTVLDYSVSGFNLPMPPGMKYASISFGDNPDNEVTTHLEVAPLVSGSLSGIACLDNNGDHDCDGHADTLLPNVEVNVFTMGPPQAGGETWLSTTTAAVANGHNVGEYEFLGLSGGQYMLDAFGTLPNGQMLNYFSQSAITISGPTTHNIAISMGEPLTLYIDETEDNCWSNAGNQDIHYDFWPQVWTFDSNPVFGESAFEDFGGGDGQWSTGIMGFPEGGVYNGFVEVPGCQNATGLVLDLDTAEGELWVNVSGGISVAGTVVQGIVDGEPLADFAFEAHTVFDEGNPNAFGNFVGTGTDALGNFELIGLSEGSWQFSTFEGASQYGFVPGLGDLSADGTLEVTGDMTDVVLVVGQKKRVNISVNDGLNIVGDAMIDISCTKGDYVHLGHSTNVYAMLNAGQSCTFSVNAWMGNYQPLNQTVTITPGADPQNVNLTLQSFNRSVGNYGGTLKADKITSFPGGKINYTGHLTGPVNGHTAKFTYPSTIPNGNVTVSNSMGSACTVNSGTVSCPVSGLVDSFFDVFVEITVPTGYADTGLSTALLVDSTNIASVYTSIVKLSMNAPAFVSQGDLFTVYGQAFPGSTVSLSRIAGNGTETKMGSTVMEPGNTWYSFKDKVINEAGTFTLKVTASAEGVAESKSKPMEVGGVVVNITDITVDTPFGTLPTNTTTGLPTGQIFEGNSFDVTLTFSGAPDTPVVGTFVGDSYAFTDQGGNSWSATVPAGWTGFGNVTFDVTTDTGDDMNDYGPVAEILVLIDPSGYVYDTVDSKRISGATATVFQLVAGPSHATLAEGTAITSITGPDTNTDGTISTAEEGTVSGQAVGKISGCGDGTTLNTSLCKWASWNASPSGQVNPQVTDAEGGYGWNVPQGWYRVSFSKAGAYSLSYSRDVYVPPAETTLNLNLGAYDIAAPTVASVNPANAANNVARNSAPVITFSEPMLASTINNSNIKLIKAGSPVDISVTYNASNYTATIQRLDAPGGNPMNLSALTAFTIRVTTAVKDDTNNAIAAQYESTFTTTGVADNVAPVSTADVATGTYGTAQTVTLSTTDDPGDGTPVACPSCNIYYTLDGTAPTTSSSIYSVPLTISTTKTLKFFAKDAAGNSEAANTRTYTITVQAPGIPQNFSGGPLTNGSSLNWDDVSGATGYKVYRSATSGSGFTLLASPASSLYADYAVTAGTTYYYKVSATNSAGESGLSAQVAVTPAAAQQQQVAVTTSSGGGGLSASITPPKDSNTLTSSVSSSVSSQISEAKTYSRPIQISSHLILADAVANQKTVEVTGKGGSITLKPNTESTIALLIPESITIQSSDKWDGKIDPPLIQSNTRISSTGGVITGSNSKLYRERIVAVVKVGSSKDTLRFSNKVTLEVPVDLADGTVVNVYSSEAGHEWTWEDTVMAEGGMIRFETDHTTYFAFEEEGDVPVLAGVSVFNDISGHWAESYINSIYEMGIVSGRSEGVFAPDDLITRAELTKIAVNAFGLDVPAGVTEKPFLDVDTGAWYTPYIQAAKENGIVEGWGDNNFAPNTPINRAAALKIFIEAAGFEDVDENYRENYESKPSYSFVFFPDVKIGEWYSKYVAYAKDFGIVGGYADGKFKPANSITRAEVAKIIMKVLELK